MNMVREQEGALTSMGSYIILTALPRMEQVRVAQVVHLDQSLTVSSITNTIQTFKGHLQNDCHGNHIKTTSKGSGVRAQHLLTAFRWKAAMKTPTQGRRSHIQRMNGSCRTPVMSA